MKQNSQKLFRTMDIMIEIMRNGEEMPGNGKETKNDIE